MYLNSETSASISETPCHNALVIGGKLAQYASRRAIYVSLPFILEAKDVKTKINNKLFGKGITPMFVFVLTILQQLVSLAGFFFFGLGLRNRFKIK